MNQEQLAVLKENIRYLKRVHLDERKSYPIMEKDSSGERTIYYNREQYLEFVIGVIFESLAEEFPELEEA